MRKLHAFRSCLLAIAFAGTAVFVCPPPQARAVPPDPKAVYAFAEQKIYGMTLTGVPGSTATISGDPLGFSVKMTSAATADNFPGVVAHNGGLDVPQSFISNGSVLAPVENYIANTSFSSPTNERVLTQVTPTIPGVAKGFDTTDPVAAFVPGQNYARSDAYVTPYTDTTNVSSPFSGTVPSGAGWPAVGNPISTGHIFAPVGSGDTLSIDSVAESLLTNADHNSIGSGVTDWVVTGKFQIFGNAGQQAALSLDFNVVERLVVYSYNPLVNISTASNTLAFDVLDSRGRSVFGPFLGTNPSATRLLSSPATGSETYNNNTGIISHLYPGPVLVNFQTKPLDVGDYTFTIKGTTTAYVSAVPEPGTNLSLAMAGAMGLVAYLRRRKGAATIA